MTRFQTVFTSASTTTRTALCATLVSLVVTVLAVASPALGAAGVHRPADAIPGQYIVLLEDDAVRGPDQSVLDGPSVPEVASQMALAHGLRLGHRFEHAAPGFVARTDENGARRLAADPRVALVEQDARVSLSGLQAEPPSWGLDRIDQRDPVLDQMFRFGHDGTGIHLFVLDTGVRTTHADFAGRIDTAESFDAVGDGRGVEDCNGHGTFVTGIAAGSTHGAAKGVTIHPVRVLGCDGTGTLSGVIAGIDWVTAAMDAHQKGKPSARWRGVANLSLEAPASLTLDRTVRRSILSGVTYVVAAGNSGADACQTSPARVDEVLTVAATDAADQRPSWSNAGPCVDLFAPGVDVTSTYVRSDTDEATGSGTSMAAPHVAAVAAIVTASYDWATPDDVRRLILEAATVGRVTGAGADTPNRLLYSAARTDSVDDPPYVTFTADCRTQQRDCVFDAGASMDDDGIVSFTWDFGDGTAEDGRDRARHRYSKNAPGPYTVTLTVIDTAGQVSTFSREIGLYWY